MRVNLLVSGVLLGVLSAFSGWAVYWAFSAYQEVTYRMPGTATTLAVGHGSEPGQKTVEPSVVADELWNFLNEHALVLVITSDGEGAPQLIVADPGGSLSWYNSARSAGSDSTDKAQGVYVFEGTYSQRQWKGGKVPALIPEGFEILGTVSPPEGVGDLQFVRPLGSYQLPPGDYTINTTDPAELAELRSIIHGAGLADHSAKSMPLGKYIRTDPLVGTTGVLLGAGSLAAVLFWTLGLRDRADEFVIRMRHGATPARLVWQVWPRGLPFQLLGVVSGGALSGVLVVGVGLQPLDRVEYLVLGAGAAGGLLLAAGTWLLATVLGVRVRGEVRHAG